MTADDALALLDAHYGLGGEAQRLPSEVDDTFRIRATDGRLYTFKIAGPDERLDLLVFQSGALQHIAATAPGLPVPRVVPGLDGSSVCVASVGGDPRRLRLLTWLEGTPMHLALAGTGQMHDLGRLLGELDRALEDYRPPILDVSLAWDLTRAADVAPWAQSIADPDLRAEVEAIFRRFEEQVLPLADELPRQVIHNDANPHNVLVEGDRVSGLIDFGDIVDAWRINDPAIAAAYQIGRPDGLDITRALLGGYMRAVEPTSAERKAMLPLVAARLAMIVAITTKRASEHPERASYILRNRPIAIAGLRTLAAMTVEDRDTFFGGQQ